MPTVFAHAAVPLAAAFALGRRRVPVRLALAGVVAAALPDADTVGFFLGIPYADDFGHRGASHSLLFAVSAAVVAAMFARKLGTGRMMSASFLFLACASHALLDAFTDGGLGVALFWPFDTTRYFAPFRPIRVSPIGAGFFGPRGLETLRSEWLWVWLPAIAAACTLRLALPKPRRASQAARRR
jgi:inner membrane protein